MKQKNRAYFIASTLVILLLVYVFSAGVSFGDYKIDPLASQLKQGLDLKGGVYIEEEILDKNVTKDMVDQAKDQIELRVNGLGVSEAVVTLTSNNRIRIEIPGIYDQKKALEQVGKTGKLTFVGPDKKVILTGTDVTDSTVVVNSQNGEPEVSLKLNAEGTKKFAEATGKFIGQQIAIYMDQELQSNPTVQSQINGGEAVINGMKDTAEAKRLAGVIKSGALPVTLAPATVKTIGASLGAEAGPTSARAALIGVALVMLFMIVYYRLPGLISCLGLAVYIMLTLLVYIYGMKATLTLPGIAGLLLSVGIAVDANVLMFERMREELRNGKSLKSALELGYHRALPSILDSNITTIISGLVLYFVGAGAVKGFALTLVVGVICSMFTALIITRFLLNTFVGAGLANKYEFYAPKQKA